MTPGKKKRSAEDAVSEPDETGVDKAPETELCLAAGVTTAKTTSKTKTISLEIAGFLAYGLFDNALITFAPQTLALYNQVAYGLLDSNGELSSTMEVKRPQVQFDRTHLTWFNLMNMTIAEWMCSIFAFVNRIVVSQTPGQEQYLPAVLLVDLERLELEALWVADHRTLREIMVAGLDAIIYNKKRESGHLMDNLLHACIQEFSGRPGWKFTEHGADAITAVPLLRGAFSCKSARSVCDFLIHALKKLHESARTKLRAGRYVIKPSSKVIDIANGVRAFQGSAGPAPAAVENQVLVNPAADAQVNDVSTTSDPLAQTDGQDFNSLCDVFNDPAGSVFDAFVRDWAPMDGSDGAFFASFTDAHDSSNLEFADNTDREGSSSSGGDSPAGGAAIPSRKRKRTGKKNTAKEVTGGGATSSSASVPIPREEGMVVGETAAAPGSVAAVSVPSSAVVVWAWEVFLPGQGYALTPQVGCVVLVDPEFTWADHSMGSLPGEKVERVVVRESGGYNADGLPLLHVDVLSHLVGQAIDVLVRVATAEEMNSTSDSVRAYFSEDGPVVLTSPGGDPEPFLGLIEYTQLRAAVDAELLRQEGVYPVKVTVKLHVQVGGAAAAKPKELPGPDDPAEGPGVLSDSSDGPSNDALIEKMRGKYNWKNSYRGRAATRARGRLGKPEETMSSVKTDQAVPVERVNPVRSFSVFGAKIRVYYVALIALALLQFLWNPWWNEVFKSGSLGTASMTIEMDPMALTAMMMCAYGFFRCLPRLSGLEIVDVVVSGVALGAAGSDLNAWLNDDGHKGGFGMVLVTLPLLWMLQSTKREIE